MEENFKDRLGVSDGLGATVIRGADFREGSKLVGRFDVECIGPDGKLKWRDSIENLVVTVGKNGLLDQALAGSTYTAVDYMGLIAAWTTGANAADTMASHTGWTEDTTNYSGNRKTCAWNAAGAGAKALSSALSFSMTGTVTINGAFIVFGSGASATKGDTGGVLLSAGQFGSGAKSVNSGDTINASYTLTLT